MDQHSSMPLHHRQLWAQNLLLFQHLQLDVSGIGFSFSLSYQNVCDLLMVAENVLGIRVGMANTFLFATSRFKPDHEMADVKL